MPCSTVGECGDFVGEPACFVVDVEVWFAPFVVRFECFG